MPNISIIVPVYNAEIFLRDCLDSILSQTVQDFEVILIDDGSSDQSGAICEEYVQTDPRFRVIHQVNQGQAAARNNALPFAEGEWIMYLDSDDLIHPQMLERLWHMATELLVPIAACGYVESTSLPKSFHTPSSSAPYIEKIDEDSLLSFSNSKKQIYWVPWCKLIKKSILQQFPFTPGRIYEDNAIVFRWLMAAGEIAIIDDPLYFYRINSAATTQKAFSVKSLDWLWALEENINYYRSNGFSSIRAVMCRTFFADANDFYEKSHNLLNNSAVLKSIASQMRRVFFKNRKHLSFSSELYPSFEIMFPKVMCIYRTFRGLWHSLSSVAGKILRQTKK